MNSIVNGGFERAGPLATRQDIIETIASWCEGLNGATSLQAALEQLVRGLRAEAGVIVRTHLAEMRPVRIATCDLACGRSVVRPLEVSFADGYFGPALARARVGSIWQSGDRPDDGATSPALPDWQASRRLKDFATMILASAGATRDHVELHFRDPISAELEATLTMLAPTMARVWASRRAGLVTRTIINHRTSEIAELNRPRGAALLGPENPARFSRAEFRVCVLLSNGLSVQTIAEELALSDATVRTHLRNIYAKTSTGSLAELVFQLVSSPAAAARAAIRRA